MPGAETIGIESIFAAFKRIIKLLREAKCPECNGSGSIPVQDHAGEWHKKPCQWHREREQLIGE